MDSKKFQINKRFIDSLEYKQDGQNIYFDKTLPGFAVRVFRSCKTYVVQARVGGKSIRRSVGKHGHLTAEQARDEAQSLLGLMAKQRDPLLVKKEKKVSGITLADLFDVYVEKRNLRPKTLSIYRDVINRCLPDWQDKPVKTLTRDMVEERLTKIANTNSVKGSGRAQAGQTYRLLRSMIRFSNEQYELDGKQFVLTDPTRNLSYKRPWTENIRRQSVIQNYQLADWFKAVLSSSNETIRDYLIFTLLTGLRKKEGLTLTWANVDLDGKYLRIDSSMTKNHQEHRLPLSDYLYKLLSRRHTLLKNKSKYVFPGHIKGSCLKEPKRVAKLIAEASGVKFMLHDLRRTFITVAEGLNILAYALKKLINHSTRNDVTGGYIVIDVERLREPMQRITDFILDQAGIIKSA